MFRSILIRQHFNPFPNRFNLIRRCLANQLTDLNQNNLKVKDELSLTSTATKSKSESKSNFNKPSNENVIINETPRIFDEDELINKLYGCVNLTEFLIELESKINELNPIRLSKIYDRLINLWYFAKQEDGYLKFNESILNSSTFKSLISHSEKLIDQLDTSCLINMLTTFSLTKLDPNNRIVRSTLNLLETKLDELTTREICDCLSAFQFYSSLNFSSNLNKYLLKLKTTCMNKASNSVLNNEIDNQNIYLIIGLIESFSNDRLNRSKEIVHLVKQLKANETKIFFNQAVKILRLLKEIRFVTDQHYNGNLDKDFYELIDSCNQKIYLNLTLESADDYFSYYLSRMHKGFDQANFYLPKFYEPRILKCISSHITNNLDKYNRVQIYNLIFNFSRFDIYDQRLLTFIYNSIREDEAFRSRLNFFQLFYLFSKLNLSFVNYDELANLVYDLNNQRIKDAIQEGSKSIKVLTDLILNDVNNTKLFKYLIVVIDNLDPKVYNRMPYQQLEDILLAKGYLMMFGRLETKELKLRVKEALDRVVDNYLRLNPSPKIYTNYIRENNKLQRGVYLSNEIYLRNVIAVYDRSTDDLVPLSNYKNYFFRIDKLPLTKDQSLIVFVESKTLQGDIGDYEFNLTDRLIRVLDSLNITYIKVRKDDISSLDLNARIHFFINKALNYFSS